MPRSIAFAAPGVAALPLAGLARSLEAQGKEAEAERARAAHAAAWKDADVVLTTSRM